MKHLIIYDSITGNTKQLADHIKQYLQNDSVTIVSIKEALPSIDSYDVLWIGSWTNRGDCTPSIQGILKNIHHKRIVLFGTAGYGGNPEYFDKIADRTKHYIPNDNEILGHFYCQGKMPQAIKEKYVQLVKANPEDQQLKVSLQNFEEALSHPNQEDFDKLQQFVLTTIKKLENHL